MKVQKLFRWYKATSLYTHTHTHNLFRHTPLQGDCIPVRTYNFNTIQSPTIQLNKKAAKNLALYDILKEKGISNIVVRD